MWCTTDVEWSTLVVASSQSSAVHRCIRNWMGWLDRNAPSSPGLRNMGTRGIPLSQQLQRFPCSLSKPPEPSALSAGACSSGGIRQCDDHDIPQSSQWVQPDFSDTHKKHFCLVQSSQNFPFCKASQWGAQPKSGFFIASFVQAWVAAESHSLQAHRQSFWTTHNQLICHWVHDTTSMLQQHVCGLVHRGGRCFHSQLGWRKQLDQCTVWSSGAHCQENLDRQGHCLSRGPPVERSSLDERPVPVECTSPIPVAPSTRIVSLGSGTPRTPAKPAFGIVCIEDLWKTRLKTLDWADALLSLVKYSLPSTTWSSYSRIISDLARFAAQHEQTLEQVTEPFLAAFVEQITLNSDQPQAKVTQFSAALSCLTCTTSVSFPFSQDMTKLIDSIVKKCTTAPLQCSAILLISLFQQLFSTWSPFLQLLIEMLHLKTVVLLAFSIMLRPSDIAPQSGKKFVQSVVSAQDDGIVLLCFHHIKNDSDRDGFQVILQPAQPVWMCRVDALLSYLSHTRIQAAKTDGVFLTLKPPYCLLCADAVWGIFNKSIVLAGLGRKEYSAKNFRPTGATMAIQAGMPLDQVHQIGCWKSTDTFKTLCSCTSS